MHDPPNPGRGEYYNVYIHHGSEDEFPQEWTNGQRTDDSGNPFLTFHQNAVRDPALDFVTRGGFQVFTYSSDSPGFLHGAHAQWYSVAAAQWYAATRRPAHDESFVEAGAIEGNPHLALWHGFGSEAPNDPVDWMFQVRPYAMHTYLFYLSEIAHVPRAAIVEGFYGGVEVSPQEYHYRRLGPDVSRGHFADWAARTTADFNYLTRAQVERARDEIVAVGDPNNMVPTIATLVDAGTGEAWDRPPIEQMPRGWAYNVVLIENNAPAEYSFEVAADAAGSEGTPAYFELRVLLWSDDQARVLDVPMLDGLAGNRDVRADAEVHTVALIVAAVPEHFSGAQAYGYDYRITRTPS